MKKILSYLPFVLMFLGLGSISVYAYQSYIESQRYQPKFNLGDKVIIYMKDDINKVINMSSKIENVLPHLIAMITKTPKAPEDNYSVEIAAVIGVPGISVGDDFDFEESSLCALQDEIGNINLIHEEIKEIRKNLTKNIIQKNVEDISRNYLMLQSSNMGVEKECEKFMAGKAIGVDILNIARVKNVIVEMVKLMEENFVSDRKYFLDYDQHLLAINLLLEQDIYLRSIPCELKNEDGQSYKLFGQTMNGLKRIIHSLKYSNVQPEKIIAYWERFIMEGLDLAPHDFFDANWYNLEVGAQANVMWEQRTEFMNECDHRLQPIIERANVLKGKISAQELQTKRIEKALKYVSDFSYFYNDELKLMKFTPEARSRYKPSYSDLEEFKRRHREKIYAVKSEFDQSVQMDKTLRSDLKSVSHQIEIIVDEKRKYGLGVDDYFLLIQALFDQNELDKTLHNVRKALLVFTQVDLKSQRESNWYQYFEGLYPNMWLSFRLLGLEPELSYKDIFAGLDEIKE